MGSTGNKIKFHVTHGKSTKRCSVCGFMIRGKNHEEGKHHKQGKK